MAALNYHDLKNYVLERDGELYKNIPNGLVALLVTHSNLKQRWPEIKVDLHTTVGELKDKLYKHGGTVTSYQHLRLRDTLGNVVGILNDDSKKLGYYGIESGMNIHIVDEDPHSLSKNGGLEDVTLVEKYVMPDEEYSKLDNSLRAYKKKQREKDPFWTFFPENRRVPATDEKEFSKETTDHIKVDERCEVMPGKRRGTVRWVGSDEAFRSGFWVGIELDEPVGKNDGTVKEKRFFTCLKNYGVFVRPDKVKIGDFPELDIENLDLSSSDSEDEIAA